MRGLWELSWNELKLSLRDPVIVFWVLAFPSLWLVFNSLIFTHPIAGSGYEDLSYPSFMLPGSVGIVILASSLIGVPLTLTLYRETAILRRLRVTPVKIWTLVLSFSISQFAFIVLGIAVLFAVGMGGFGVRVYGSWLTLIGVICFGMLTILAIGSAIGSIARSYRAANIIIWAIFTPTIMLSGLFLPVSILPDWLQPVARVLPLTPINTMVRDIVYGHPLDDLWRLVIMGGWIVVALLVTLIFFRWE